LLGELTVTSRPPACLALIANLGSILLKTKEARAFLPIPPTGAPMITALLNTSAPRLRKKTGGPHNPAAFTRSRIAQDRAAAVFSAWSPAMRCW
jgi:hypothetical protein